MNILHNNGYFAAANTKNGFVSYFDTVFSEKELDFLYIIKGGSGTGKSRFMRETADAAEKKGERTELFFCSSDPKSLDGIILKDRRIAVIDGTSPHVSEPKAPGCFDEILNFAQFWDNKKLISMKPEITALQGRKKELYKKAYGYLSGAGELSMLSDMLRLPAINLDKANRFAERFAQKLERSADPRETLRITRAISYLGISETGAFEDKAEHHICLLDKAGVSSTILAAMRRALTNRGVSFEYSLDPLSPEKVGGIYLTDSKTSITVSNDYENADHVINCERFIENNILKAERTRLKFLENSKNQMLAMASGTMKEIFELHSRVEELYTSAMDFSKKEEFTREFIKRIFG